MTHHIQLDQLMTNENNIKIEKKDDLIINIFTGSRILNFSDSIQIDWFCGTGSVCILDMNALLIRFTAGSLDTGQKF